MARVPHLKEGGGRTVETSENRITIRETLDGLGIYNPARRNAFAILFMMLWLTGWAFGARFALSEILRGSSIVSSLFLLVWMAFWTVAGLGALVVLLWNLFGSERLFITDGMLVHSRGFGPFRRKRIYPVGQVNSFRVDTRGNPATNAVPLGSVSYQAGGGVRSFGVGMTREEAEASLAAIRRALPFPDSADFPPPSGEET